MERELAAVCAVACSALVSWYCRPNARRGLGERGARRDDRPAVVAGSRSDGGAIEWGTVPDVERPWHQFRHADWGVPLPRQALGTCYAHACVNLVLESGLLYPVMKHCDDVCAAARIDEPFPGVGADAPIRTPRQYMIQELAKTDGRKLTSMRETKAVLDGVLKHAKVPGYVARCALLHWIHGMQRTISMTEEHRTHVHNVIAHISALYNSRIAMLCTEIDRYLQRFPSASRVLKWWFVGHPFDDNVVRDNVEASAYSHTCLYSFISGLVADTDPWEREDIMYAHIGTLYGPHAPRQTATRIRLTSHDVWIDVAQNQAMMKKVQIDERYNAERLAQDVTNTLLPTIEKYAGGIMHLFFHDNARRVSHAVAVTKSYGGSATVHESGYVCRDPNNLTERVPFSAYIERVLQKNVGRRGCFAMTARVVALDRVAGGGSDGSDGTGSNARSTGDSIAAFRPGPDDASTVHPHENTEDDELSVYHANHICELFAELHEIETVFLAHLGHAMSTSTL